MYNRKPPFRRNIKKGDINKEAIENIEDTKRKLKEKIPQQARKKKKIDD